MTREYETAAAVHELLDVLRALDEKWFDGPVAIADDEASVLEAYKWMFSILQVANDVYLWADTNRPRFVDIVGPYKKWGGDNADAYYMFAPIDPTRTYRVRGTRGDAVYFSLTVYGGPNDGRYTERIVQTVNDRALDFGPDGSFEIILSPHEYPGNWLRLEPDAVHAITRDYVPDYFTSRRVAWHIECLDGDATLRLDDAEVARRFRAVITWVEEQAGMVPLAPGEPNTVDPPYPVPQTTYGWAAGDAAYAMGTFDLADGEALVLRGRSPECAFWNLCLWNPFLHTYNFDYDRVSINGTQVEHEPDGSWTIVVSEHDPGHPNWVRTQGHRRGRLWFRWFHPSATPVPISAEVTHMRR